MDGHKSNKKEVRPFTKEQSKKIIDKINFLGFPLSVFKSGSQPFSINRSAICFLLPILNGIYWVDDSTTYVIDTSISSQSRLAHASIHGNETNITERKWSMTKEIETAEGIKWISERLTLPMSKFKQMVVAVVDHIDTCYDVEETHLAAIAALTTAQEVFDYDITPNWPSNPVHVELL